MVQVFVKTLAAGIAVVRDAATVGELRATAAAVSGVSSAELRLVGGTHMTTSSNRMTGRVGTMMASNSMGGIRGMVGAGGRTRAVTMPSAHGTIMRCAMCTCAPAFVVVVAVILHVTARTRGMAKALIMHTLPRLRRPPRLPRLRRAPSGACALRMVSSSRRRRRLSTATPTRRRKRPMGRVPTVIPLLAGMRTLMLQRRRCTACKGLPRLRGMGTPVQVGWVVVVVVAVAEAAVVEDMAPFGALLLLAAAAASGATRTVTGAATVRSGPMRMTRLRASSAASPAIAHASATCATTASGSGIVRLCALTRGPLPRA